MFRTFLLAAVLVCAVAPATYALENPNLSRPAPTPATRAEEQFILASPLVKAKLKAAKDDLGLVYSNMTAQSRGYNATFVLHLKSPTQPRLGGGFFTANLNGGGIVGKPFVTSVSDFTLLR